MRIVENIKQYFFNFLCIFKKVPFFFYKDISTYQLGSLFWERMQNSSIKMRATYIAFNLFIAMFPAFIFLFTLLPYIPIDNAKEEIFTQLQEFIPGKAFLSLKLVINDIILQKRVGLLSIGFLLTIYFATNSMNAFLVAFNTNLVNKSRYNFLKQRIISLILLLVISTLFIIAFSLIIFSKFILNYLITNGILQENIVYYLIVFGKWVTVMLFLVIAMSFMYSLSVKEKVNKHFISIGAVVSSFLFVITSLLFSFYVNNFGSYNKFYGSLGTIIIILLWLYYNAIAILIGFEINISINNAKKI